MYDTKDEDLLPAGIRARDSWVLIATRLQGGWPRNRG